MNKDNIDNLKRVLSTIVEQIIHITGSNNINTYKLLPVLKQHYLTFFIKYLFLWRHLEMISVLLFSKCT